LFLDAAGDEASKADTDATFRSQIERQLSEARLAAQDADFDRADVDAASFAVIAWIDESVQCSDWKYAAQWGSRPLQKTYFNTTRAGVEFFKRLDALTVNQAAVREVFFLCLAMGFKGRYAADGGRIQLEEIKAREFKALVGKDAEALAKLFPTAYPEVSAAPPHRRWHISRTDLALFGGPVAVLALLYIVFRFVLSSQANDFLRLIQ
ncbi:MAG TPA: DotU family type IV/VI secretion system protein, partial [Rhodocyclaceae bacterium]|nr:DotU family type IV/VI secretion system protein [Rhodocyclaceae bacterium]